MQVSFLMLKKNGSVKSIAMSGDVATFGRRRDCDFRLPLMGISRRHCQLEASEDSIRIRDLKSRNGTMVNGKAVQECKLNAGDTFKVGPVTFLLQIDGKPEGIDGSGLVKQDDSVDPSAKTDVPSDMFADIDDLDLDDLDLDDSGEL